MEAQYAAYLAERSRKEWDMDRKHRPRTAHPSFRLAKKVAAASAVFTPSQPDELPLFARVSGLQNVPVLERRKMINRSRTGCLSIERQVTHNLDHARRASCDPHFGDRFKDHGSIKVLEEVVHESSTILKQNDSHQLVRQERLEAAKKDAWVRPRDKEKRAREESRRSCNLHHHSVIACPELEMGKWSSVLSIEKAACLSFKVEMGKGKGKEIAKAKGADAQPSLVVQVAGETDGDDPDVFMSRLEVPTIQSYQWRSTSAGEDIISIHPCDPGYAAMGMYYITVTRCLPPSLLPCTTLP